jgi:hypothetical protein
MNQLRVYSQGIMSIFLFSQNQTDEQTDGYFLCCNTMPQPGQDKRRRIGGWIIGAMRPKPWRRFDWFLDVVESALGD